jgi:hypothetical protein
MARMKIEFLHHYKQRHGHTLRDRLVGHLPRYAALGGAPAAAHANLRNRSGWLAKLAEPMTGFSARRKLPAFRRDRFTAIAPVTAPAAHVAPAAARWCCSPTPSTTVRARDPAAAQRVLAAAGYEVGGRRRRRPAAVLRPHLPRHRHGRAGARRGAPHARCAAAGCAPAWRGRPGAFVPADSLRDEFLVLGSAPRRQELAPATLLFEEFIVREAGPAASTSRFRPLAHRAAAHALPPEGVRRRSPPCSRRWPWCPS